MFPYDQADGEWMNEIFIYSLKLENQKLENEMWKPYKTDKLREKLHNKIWHCVKSLK